MEIHHYTRASTLSLILQSGKIRFTRADQLDDGSEMPFKTAHLDPRNYFVSSWTEGRREHSGQWYRYGDRHRGIRITLPRAPFEFHPVSWEISRDPAGFSPPAPKVGFQLNDVTIPFTTTEILGRGYVLIPYSDMNTDFGGPVEYVSNPTKRVTALLSGDDSKTVIHDAGKLGRIKSEEWADQIEYRFVLMAQEGPALTRSCSPGVYDNALLDLLESQVIAGNVASLPLAEFIDLPLGTGILNKMTITLGSLISNHDREMVKNAIRLHAPTAHIFESIMNVRGA